MQQRKRKMQQSPTIRRFQYRLNRWSLIALFFAIVLLIILYVSNVLAIQRRAREVAQLQERYQALVEENERLQQQVYQLESPERIQRIAMKRLGLRFSTTPPKVITPIER